MLSQTYLREIAEYITQRAKEYRPPVLGNNEVNSLPVLKETSSFKYFPVVRLLSVRIAELIKRGCVCSLGIIRLKRQRLASL